MHWGHKEQFPRGPGFPWGFRPGSPGKFVPCHGLPTKPLRGAAPIRQTWRVSIISPMEKKVFGSNGLIELGSNGIMSTLEFIRP